MLLRFAITVMTAMLLLPAGLMAASAPGDVVYKMKSGTTVSFSHASHLKKSKDCRSCHTGIYDPSRHKTYTMAEMEKGKSCGSCHNGTKVFSVAKEKDCVRCHTNSPGPISYKIKGADAFFSHDSHSARAGAKCKTCHNGKVITGKRNVTMAQMEKGASCGSCHNGKKAFTAGENCNSCHKQLTPRNITFKMKPGVTDAAFSHEFHTAVYKCNDCHTKVFPYRAGKVHFTMADMEKGKSCGTCHDGKSAFSSSGDCAKCHKGFKTAPITFKIKSGYKNASFSHEFHQEVYKCKDCHTKLYPYGRGKEVSMKGMKDGASCGACHNDKDAFSVAKNCSKCHQ